jgi:hypothetical protein
LVASEQWFQKALSLAQDNELHRQLAICYFYLGSLAGVKGRCLDSGEWLIRAVLSSARISDPELFEISTDNFAVTYEYAPPDTKEILERMWQEADLGTIPNAKQDKNRMHAEKEFFVAR